MPRLKFQTLTEQMFYTLLSLKAEMIQETKVEGRRHSYILTEKGKEMLDKEYQRICSQALDYRAVFGEEEVR